MTQRLVRLVRDSWMTFDGWCASRGIDPEDLYDDRLMSLIYHWATYRGEKADIEKFDADLYRPPKGEVATVGPWTAEAETQALAAFASQVG